MPRCDWAVPLKTCLKQPEIQPFPEPGLAWKLEPRCRQCTVLGPVAQNRSHAPGRLQIRPDQRPGCDAWGRRDDGARETSIAWLTSGYGGGGGWEAMSKITPRGPELSALSRKVHAKTSRQALGRFLCLPFCISFLLLARETQAWANRLGSMAGRRGGTGWAEG